MSLQYHPDKVGGGADATKKFNEIKSARELLGSGNRRIMALPQWGWKLHVFLLIDPKLILRSKLVFIIFFPSVLLFFVVVGLYVL